MRHNRSFHRIRYRCGHAEELFFRQANHALFAQRAANDGRSACTKCASEARRADLEREVAAMTEAEREAMALADRKMWED